MDIKKLSDLISDNEVNQINCHIQTPQFKDGKIHEMKKQKGIFYKDTMLFMPYTYIGTHQVQFHSFDDFRTAIIDLYADGAEVIL